jgi:hypothetical protein
MDARNHFKRGNTCKAVRAGQILIIILKKKMNKIKEIRVQKLFQTEQDLQSCKSRGIFSSNKSFKNFIK